MSDSFSCLFPCYFAVPDSLTSALSFRKDNNMGRSQMSSEEVGRLGDALYQQSIRAQVETPENIGKMIIIDVETGDYEIDDLGLTTARHLHAKHPDAALYGIRIGYDVAEALGGVMERVAS